MQYRHTVIVYHCSIPVSLDERLDNGSVAHVGRRAQWGCVVEKGALLQLETSRHSRSERFNSIEILKATCREKWGYS